MSAEVSENTPGSGSVRTYTDGAGRGNKPLPVHLLVMGPQGCGKSRFINLVTGQNECMTSTTSKLCTKFARSCKNSKWINGYEFRFIDTPGFGNEIIDNRRVFERLVEYFAPNPRDNRYEGPNLPRRVTGLLYIHSEAEPFKDRMSPKAMEMLVKILGEQFLDRVTVLIRSQDKIQVDYSNFTPSKDSPLYPLYCNRVKPWTAAYEEDSQAIHNILDPYIPLHPRLVRLAALDNFAQRDGNNWQYDDIPRHLREFFPEDVGPSIIASQPDVKMRLQEQEGEISRLRDLLANREKEIQDLRSTHDNEVEDARKQRETERSNNELNLKSLYNTIRDQEGQISKLKEENDSELKELETFKEQVRRLELEKELKIKEHQDKLEEMNEEVTRLKGDNQQIIQESINAMQAKEREIMQLRSASRSNGITTKANNKQEEEVYRLNEEIHKIKTEYGSLRNHMQLEENVEQADITTALGDINRLIEEFGQSLSEYIENHMKNDSSGTSVSTQTLLSLFGSVGSETPPKIKQDAYLLLEYAVQATVCDKLYTHLFKPFHPSIADDEKRDAFITRLYEQMTYQEAQPVAGRWRKDAFNTISKHPSLGNPENFDDKRMHRIITQALSELLGKVFKTLPAEMLKEHDRALVKVINKAEELNRLVKGEVSILGDFTPVVFHFGDVFQPDYMYEVSSKPKKTRHPESIIATVGASAKKVATLLDQPRDEPHQPLSTSIPNLASPKPVMFGHHPGPGPNSHPSYQQNGNRGNWAPPLCILVMGPRGCGKSSLINLAIGRSDCEISNSSGLCTQSFQFCNLPKWMNGVQFRFTDTPGLGNEAIDDRRILELLIEYLAPNPHGASQDGPNLPRMLLATGLLYIYSDDEPFRSRTSRKTSEMLVKVLGEQFLDRVTVLLRSQHIVQTNLSDYMPPEDSPLYPFYCGSTKPWTVAYQYDPQCIEYILWRYIGVNPPLVRIAALDNFVQQGDGNCNWQYDEIPRHLRELFPEDVGPPAILSNADLRLRLREQENELERLTKMIDQGKKEMEAFRVTHAIVLKALEKASQEEKFNHEIGMKSLYNTIKAQEVEISELKLAKDSERELLEKLKDEQIGKLDSEIRELQDALRMKGEEIIELERVKDEEARKIGSEKDLEIKALRDEIKEKEEELMKLKKDNERRIQESASTIQAKDNETVELKTNVNGATTKTGGQQEDEILRLNAEIHRISAEYASLRNHMQLEENTEQADITTSLGDINRLVEELAGSLSEHIEKHMEDNPSKQPLQPQDLLGLFGQSGEGAPKVKQDAYVLLEYAVQGTICDTLHRHLFVPFHPSIVDDENRNMFITQLYEQIAYKEPQSVAGRWRKDAFNALSKDRPGSKEDKRMHQVITGALSLLLGKVAGIKPDEVLKEHDRALIKIINKAEELNGLVKGGVSILGDFQPIIFPFGDKFQPEYMSGTSSKLRKEKQPETILATIELGIVKRCAVGGNRKPEETVLRKATVFGLLK